MYTRGTGRQPDYGKMSLREELEARFAEMEAQEKKKKQEQNLIPQPDYSQMSLRQELESRFAELERQEQVAKQPPVSLNQPQMLPEMKKDPMEEFKEIATKLGYGAKGFAQGAYGAAQNMANQLYQGGEALGNTVAKIGNAVTEIQNNYFRPRNPYNRYKTDCTPSNIAYNTISSMEQMPSSKPIYSVLTPVQSFDLTPVKDLLLYPNRYFRAYKTGEKIGRYTTSLYNALDEANCL